MAISNEEKTLRALTHRLHGAALRDIGLTILEAFRVNGWGRYYWSTGANSCYMEKDNRILYLRGINDGAGARIEIRQWSRGPVVKSFRPGEERQAEIWIRRGCLGD